MSEKYNGWTNYETWNVALWMGNDQGSQEQWEEVAQDCWSNAEASSTFTREEQATLDMSKALKEQFEEGRDTLLEAAGKWYTSSVWADLLGAALSEVNWHEIAEHYIADMDKAEEEEATEEA